MPGTRRKGNPEREINNLFATLNQEQEREKHDINGLYEGRLRSHAQNFEVSNNNNDVCVEVLQSLLCDLAGSVEIHSPFLLSPAFTFSPIISSS